MEKQKVIERFCALASKVGNEKYKSQYAADCFCGTNPNTWLTNNFQFEEPIMKFIEEAIEEKLQGVTK